MVVDHDDANDITQDVFIKAWTALENFRGDAKLYTWLYRIASNEAINFLNKSDGKYFIPIYDVENELSEKLEADPDAKRRCHSAETAEGIIKITEKSKGWFLT